MKLAWWREALVALDERDAPAEPLLQAAKKNILPAGVSGTDAASLTDGWEHLLAEDILGTDYSNAYADARGGTLFRLSAQLLGCEPPAGLEAAGAGWALVDLARHSSRASDAGAALELARARLAEAPRTWPAGLRPLGMLAVLARYDATAGPAMAGSPGRMLRMLAHRITGR
jgi:15-cis-phytoene synthase